MPNFSLPSALFVATGSRKTGPTPQMMRPDLAGEKNAVATTSPSPLMRVPSGAGCDVSGMMTRRITFVLGLTREGHHRLNVEQRGGGVAVAEAEVPVALQRHADQAGHRVLRLLRQFIGALRRGRGRQHQLYRERTGQAERTKFPGPNPQLS